MGNEKQNLILYYFRKFKIDTENQYRKLKSSKIILDKHLDFNSNSFINKTKTHFKRNKREKVKKRINIFDIKNEINSNMFDRIIHKSISLSLTFRNHSKNERKKNYSLPKDIKKYIKYKIKFEEDLEKEKTLKLYLENNNELLLSNKEFKIAYQAIKEEVTKNKFPVKNPIAITLGGQPGAGKSNLYQIAKKRFSGNIVELDCDAFRIFHPYYNQIKKIFYKDDAVKTNPFVFKVVDLLIEELSDEKYNLIIESSLNSPNSALDNGKNLNPKGYKVELQIMATPKQISWQGTIDRYNRALKNGESPRAVSKEFHDKVVENICTSLDIVKKSGLMSNILIYNRNQTCLYNMEKNKNTNPCLLLYLIINGFFSKYLQKQYIYLSSYLEKNWF